ALVPVVVPRPRRRQHQVAAAHDALVTLDRGKGAVALDDEPDRGRRMTMGRGDLAREQVLKAGPERVRRAVARRETRIDEPEHPSFGAATQRGQLAAPPDEGQERVPAPEV